VILPTDCGLTELPRFAANPNRGMAAFITTLPLPSFWHFCLNGDARSFRGVMAIRGGFEQFRRGDFSGVGEETGGDPFCFAADLLETTFGKTRPPASAAWKRGYADDL
jgi:hypothetical protein